MFPLLATGVVDTGGKFAAGIVDTGGKFATAVSTTLAILVAQFTAGVVDTGGAPLTCEYLQDFYKKFEMTLMLFFSGAWGKMIHEKNLKQKLLFL